MLRSRRDAARAANERGRRAAAGRSGWPTACHCVSARADEAAGLAGSEQTGQGPHADTPEPRWSVSERRLAV